MPVPRYVGLEVHVIPPRIHHGEGIIFVLVIAQPRVVGQLGDYHEVPIL